MDYPPNTPESNPSSDAPGKLRTWWHPLLVNFLRWQLEPLYQVIEEVSVGRKPLQIDVVLLRKTAGDLPEESRRILAGLCEHLNERTLVEFKGPTDSLAAGDFRTFLAYANLYCAQNEPLLAAERLTLLVIAPGLTEGYRQELRSCGVNAQADEPGIWRLQGALPYPMWLLETDVLAGLSHPLLTLFSPALLRDHLGVMRQLQQAGYQAMVVYMGQQVQQLQQKGEEFM